MAREYKEEYVKFYNVRNATQTIVGSFQLTLTHLKHVRMFDVQIDHP